MTDATHVKEALDRASQGGPERHRAKSIEQGKLFVRDRIALLLDDGSFVEDGLLANAAGDGLPPTAWSPASAACTAGRSRHGQRLDGQGRLVGRAHRREDRPHPGDGARARAAARLPRRLGGRAHHRSDRDVPGPPRTRAASSTTRCSCRARCRRSACCSARRRRAARTSRRSATWCSWSTSNASMYLGSPRMAEMVIGEKVTLEEMGGARMHCEVSGCGDLLVKTDEEAHRRGARATSPTSRTHWASAAARRAPRAPAAGARAIRRAHPRRRERAVRHARA